MSSRACEKVCHAEREVHLDFLVLLVPILTPHKGTADGDVW